jgi:hypothetical protein
LISQSPHWPELADIESDYPFMECPMTRAEEYLARAAMYEEWSEQVATQPGLMVEYLELARLWREMAKELAKVETDKP